MKADPECPHQRLAVPSSDHSTSWYMLEYAHNQDRWLADFVSVFDKMMTNGYSDLIPGPDQSADIGCSCQAEFLTPDQRLTLTHKYHINHLEILR